MRKDFLELLHTSVELELGMSKLYRLFYEKLDSDRDFWWDLSIEELNHASLIRTGENIPMGYFPQQLLCKEIDLLKKERDKVLNVIKKYENMPITRDTAFNLAIKFEESAGETHYQLAMTSESPDDWTDLFKQLNGDDIDHRNRIKEYVKYSNPGDEDTGKK